MMHLYQFTLTAEDGGQLQTTQHYVAAPNLRAARDYAAARAAEQRLARPAPDGVQPVQALTGIPGTDGRKHTFPVFALETIAGLLTDAIRTLQNADALLAGGRDTPASFGGDVLKLSGLLGSLAAPGQANPFAIRSGFQEWIHAPARARSPEVDYGCWWVLGHPRDWPKWRVSLIVDTREVYAVALDRLAPALRAAAATAGGQRPERFIYLGQVPEGEDARTAMEQLMDGWAEGALRLPELFGRFCLEAEPASERRAP